MASLREVFEQVRGQGAEADPAGALRDGGHADLPEPLVSLAVVNFADTLPAPAAEHLAQFVVAHSGVPVDGVDQAEPPAGDGLHLLATAPSGWEPEHDLDSLGADPAETGPHRPEDGFGAGADPADLDFGAGEQEPAAATGPADPPDAAGEVPADLWEEEPPATAPGEPTGGLPEQLPEPPDDQPDDDLDLLE